MQTARFHPHMAGHQIVLKSNLEETTQHGSEGFPAALYETVFRSKMLRYVPLHWHKELQLCLILTGRVRFSINQKEVEAGAGDVIFINSQVIHSATLYLTTKKRLPTAALTLRMKWSEAFTEV